jgi:single-strand DNA-binding protein
MMLNKVQIIGRVGKDPEVRYATNGDAIANFTVATSERYKDKQTGEAVEKTEWHNVSAFRRLGEIVGEYVRKGSLIYIEGKIQTRKYEKDGIERYATSIVASEMKMLGGKSEGQQQQGQPRPATRAPASQPQGSGFDDMDDDIPFN